MAEHHEELRELLGHDVVVDEVRSLVGTAEVCVGTEPALIADVVALVVPVENRVERGSDESACRDG